MKHINENNKNNNKRNTNKNNWKRQQNRKRFHSHNKVDLSTAFNKENNDQNHKGIQVRNGTCFAWI